MVSSCVPALTWRCKVCRRRCTTRKTSSATAQRVARACGRSPARWRRRCAAPRPAADELAISNDWTAARPCSDSAAIRGRAKQAGSACALGVASAAVSRSRPPTECARLPAQIRSSLLAIAEEQGLDGHRSCLTKFSELLLLNGVISTQQMGVALDLVEALFEPGAECSLYEHCMQTSDDAAQCGRQQP